MTSIFDQDPPTPEEVAAQAKLEKIAALIAEVFPCSDGWTYELDLYNTETEEYVGISHGDHDEEPDGPLS